MKKSNFILPFLIIFVALYFIYLGCDQASSGSSSGGGGGSSILPEISISQSGTIISNGEVNYDIGTTQYGLPVNITFTVKNNGASILNLTGTPVVDLSGDAVFTLDTSSTLDSVDINLSTDFIVTFNPAASGVFTAVISIENNDDTPFSFSIEGTAVDPAPDINVKEDTVNIPDGASNYDLGSVQVGDSETTTFTIENLGLLVLNLNGTPIVNLAGDAEFTINTAATVSSVVGSNSTNFNIIYTPTAQEVNTATITIASDDSDENPYTFTVAATGIPPAPEINVKIGTTDIPDETADYNIGSTITGTPYTVTFTIENKGVNPLGLSGTPIVELTGDLEFSIDTSLTSTSVAALGGTTTFDVTFSPSLDGIYNASLLITNNDSDEDPYNFTITAKSGIPEINVLDDSTTIADESVYDIGSTSPGTPIVKTFTIENTGTLELDLNGTPIVSVTGDAEYTLDLTSTSTQVSINENTTFTLTFTPTTYGSYSTVINIPNTDLDESPYNFTVNTLSYAPEMHIVRADNSDDVADEDVNVTLGNGVTAGTYDYTFIIYNEGNETLNLTGSPIVNISGDNFTVLSQPSSSQIASGENVSFTVRFTAIEGTGWNDADISITNDDYTENPYNFNVRIRPKN